MGRWYKMIDAIDKPKTYQIYRRSNGRIVYENVTLQPNKKYALPDDEIFEKSLQSKEDSRRVDANPKLKDYLKKLGIPYEIKTCPVCGGNKVPKIHYKEIEFGGE